MFIIPIKIIKFNKKERLGGNWNRLDCVSIWYRNKQPKNNSEVSVPPRTNEKYKWFGSQIKQCVLNLEFSTPKKYRMRTFKGIFKTTAVSCINSSLQQQPPFNFKFLFTAPGKKHTQTNPTMLLSPPSHNGTTPSLHTSTPSEFTPLLAYRPLTHMVKILEDYQSNEKYHKVNEEIVKNDVTYQY